MNKIATLHTTHGDWVFNEGSQISGNVNANGVSVNFYHNLLSNLISFSYMGDTRQLSFTYEHSVILDSVLDYSNAVVEMAELHLEAMTRIYGTLKKGGDGC